MRREVRFPGLVTARPAGEPSLEEALNQLRDPARGRGSGPLAPVGVFTGRDGLFYELETAARLQRVLVLTGPAGTGKTELAKAFGRWWQDTGGVERPGWVFWHSFEPGVASFSLDGVIAEIGPAVFGPDFVALDDAERAGVVEGFLRDRRALLIWDNFESVRSLPDPTAATPPLDDAECQRLRGFLHRLAADGRSAVLVTSRSDEVWLDEADKPVEGGGPSPGNLRRIRVGGLLPEEATAYAGELLAPYPAAARRRADRAFGELMEWLDGHPLSMRLVLRYLDTTDPGALLDGLQGTAPLPGWDEARPGRTTSLRASLRYSFAHLAPAAQRLLTAVCLFHTVADAGVLAFFSSVDGVPEPFGGITQETWAGVLDAAAGAGLLTTLGGGIYQIHPALPAYLAALWRTQEPAGYEAQRAAATRALLIAYAAFAGWLNEQIGSGDTGLVYTIIGLQQRTMGHMLGYALDGKYWAEAQAIAQPLNKYWEARGRYTEAGAWTDRVRLAVEDTNGIPPSLDHPAGSLWLFFSGSEANRQRTSGHLDAAELTYRKILAMLQAQPHSPSRQNRLARTHHQLGWVAQDRGRLDEAEDWYTRSLAIQDDLGDRPLMAASYHHLGIVAEMRGRLDEAEDWHTRSLAIKDDLGDRPGMATSYHELGMVAQMRGQLGEAEDWYTRSLAIQDDLGDRPGMAGSYHQLGIVAQWRGRLDEAGDWYTRSLAIQDDLGDRPGMAGSYHQLGIVAQMRGRLDEAEDWYTRSLAILEELGDRPRMAGSYHELGMVAQRRGRLDEAGDWYTRSLAITEELGDRRGMALTYSQCGLLAEERRDLALALEWTVRCVALFDDVPHPGAGTDLDQLARLTHQLGIDALEACWQQVTGGSLPDAVHAYVHSYSPETGDASDGGDR